MSALCRTAKKRKIGEREKTQIDAKLINNLTLNEL